MKKMLTITLAVLMLCTMVVPAFASTTSLTTTVPEATYTLNIPADQEIPFGKTKMDIGNITVSDSAGFAEGKDLQVTISYDDFTAEGVDTTIPYRLYLAADDSYTGNYSPTSKALTSGTAILFEGKTNGAVAEKVVMDTNYSQGGQATQLSISVVRFYASSEDWGKALAGEYTSTITFTAEVVVSE